MDRWRSELHALFTHLHETIRQSFITNYASPAAPPPANSFTNAKPPPEQRFIDERGIVRNANGDPIHGGSTATMVVLVKDATGGGATLITANVGDSTGFLVPTRGTWDFLSVDHGPENQDEWVRINTSAEEAHLYSTKLLFVYDKTNVFRKYECPCVFLPDGTKDQQYVANPWGYGLHPTNVRYEPAVYAVTPRHISKDSTCIAMTRALGDCYAHQFGLTHIPSISVKRLSCNEADAPATDMADDAAGSQNAPNSYATQEQTYTIFVASDGVWDCWRYDDLMQFINDELYKRGKNLLEMGEAVLEESISRAITNFGAKHYDDACLVVWQFTTKKCGGSSNGHPHLESQPTANGLANGAAAASSSSVSSLPHSNGMYSLNHSHYTPASSMAAAAASAAAAAPAPPAASSAAAATAAHADVHMA